jgi:hypothetical protein
VRRIGGKEEGRVEKDGVKDRQDERGQDKGEGLEGKKRVEWKRTG